MKPGDLFSTPYGPATVLSPCPLASGYTYVRLETPIDRYGNGELVTDIMIVTEWKFLNAPEPENETKIFTKPINN